MSLPDHLPFFGGATSQSRLLHNALWDQTEAEISDAVARLNIYYNSSVGIGEHPQHTEEMRKLIDKIASARDAQSVLMFLDVEYRQCSEDGRWYRLEEFIDWYGNTDGTLKWKQAKSWKD